MPEKKTETPKTSRPAKQTLSLFDDDEEEEEGDLFGAPTAKPATAKPSSASKVRSEESLRLLMPVNMYLPNCYITHYFMDNRNR